MIAPTVGFKNAEPLMWHVAASRCARERLIEGRPLLYLGWYFLSLLLVVAFHDCNHAKPDHGNARDNEHYQRKAVGIARHS